MSGSDPAGPALPVLAATIAAVLVGLVAGEILRRRLRLGRHRLAEERDLPGRHVAWVPSVVAGGAALLVWQHGATPFLALALACAVPWLVALAAVDLDVRRLPDYWTLPAVPVVTVLLGVQALLVDDWSRWSTAMLVGVGNAACYLLLHLLNPAGLGRGDVKLALPLGMLTGWFGLAAAVLGFLLTFGVGLLVGLVVAVRSGGGRYATFPFGPSMILGAAGILALAGPGPT